MVVKLKKTLVIIKQFLLHDLWILELEHLSRLTAFIYRSLRLFYLVVREFIKDQLLVQAGSLVYSTLFAIVPFLVVMFYIMEGFGHQEMLQQTLLIAMQPLGEKTLNTIVPKIMQFVQNTNLKTIGIIGFIILIITLISILFTIELSFNRIWCRMCRRNWRRRFLAYLSLILIGPVLVVLIIGMTTFWQSAEYAETIKQIPFIQELYQKLFPLVLSWLVIFLVILIMPSAKVRIRSALVGAVIGGTLWHLVNVLIARFMVSVYESGTQAAIYAGFAALPLFLFYMFFGWSAVLLASEISYAHQNIRKLVLEEKYKRISFIYEEGLTLRILLLITRAVQHGQRPPSIESLSMAMEVPESAIDELLEIMIAKDIVKTIDDDTTRYILARDPQAIAISEILLALRQTEDESVKLLLPLSVKIVQLQNEINQAIEAVGKDKTLADLVEP
ncbi:YihY family inner membrane protein [candidate division KSB1 bacterium]|nr:YihY family inner membrane protein [candidate division KSB1 bacterium]